MHRRIQVGPPDYPELRSTIPGAFVRRRHCPQNREPRTLSTCSQESGLHPERIELDRSPARIV